MSGIYTLATGGYADTETDYKWHHSKESALRYFDAIPNYMVDKSPGNVLAHVFDDTRTPWNEHDAYPDSVVEVGARGGLKLTPA